MSLTLEQMRETFSRNIGDWLSETSTGAGLIGGATVVCSALSPYNDDHFNGWHIRITSGIYDGEERQISDFVSSTSPYGTITVSRAFTGQITTSVTFELRQRCRASDIMAYLNMGADLMYKHIYPEVESYYLVTDNLINVNHDLETYSAGFTGWTATTITAAEESAIILPKYGSTKSAKLTRAGATGYFATTSANQSLLTLYCRPSGLAFYAWVYATVASQVRLAINDGATTTYGDYHDGNSEWQLLSASASIAEDAGVVGLRVYVEADGDVYVDEAFCVGGGHLREHTIPSALDDVHNVEVEREREGQYPYNDVRFKIGGSTIYLLDTLSSGYHLKVSGKKAFTALTADTSSWAIDTNEASVIIAASIATMHNAEVDRGTSEDATRSMNRASFWTQEAERLGRRYGKRPPPNRVRY